jgi:hypothetical protein
MSLNIAHMGRVLWDGTTNDIKSLQTRLTSSSDDAAKFFSRNRISRYYLYYNLQADLDASTNPNFDLFTLGANDVSFQVIGTATLTFKGSLDGVNFVDVTPYVEDNGIYRITVGYTALRVSTVSTGREYSVYMVIR